MTKILNKPTKYSSTAKKSFLVSKRPKTEFLYRTRRKTPIPFVVIAVIVLSPAYHYSFAADETTNAGEHAHRHHHIPAQSHHTEPIVLNKCNISTYPPELESFMESLDKRLTINERIETAGNWETWEDHVEKMQSNLSKAKPSVYHQDEEDTYVDIPSLTDHAVKNDFWHPPAKLLHGMQHSKWTFRILDAPFQCPAGTFLQTLHWHSLGVNKRDDPYSIKVSEVSLLKSNGHLMWSKENGHRHEFTQNNYCVWKHDNEWVSFMVCMPTVTQAEIASSYPIHKCCPKDMIVDQETKGCKPSNPKWRPNMYKREGGVEIRMDDREVPLLDSLKYEIGYPSCIDKYPLTRKTPNNNFKLFLNGTLIYVEEDAKTLTYIDPGEFCIDGLQFISNSNTASDEWDQIAIVCKPQADFRIRIFAVLNVISALFLLLTDIVYVLIWRHQNNIHSWLQFSYSTSLFITYTCFAIVQLWQEDIPPALCKIMGWTNHSAYLSAFFWLTSMNFDLWWRFSRPLRSTRVQTQEKKRKRYIYFALFSTVTPLLISCIGITLDIKYGDNSRDPPHITIPRIGEDRCYFKDQYAKIPYLYVPAGILLLVDFVFFASTVMHLRKMHTHTELARTQSTSTLEDKKGFKVIAKLFIVMGVLWVFELVAWICRFIFAEYKLTMDIIFTPLECLNCIQGVFIFFIFICKPSVRNQLAALFRRDDPTKIWNKQTQLPSVTTVLQPVVDASKDYVQVK